MKARLLVAAAVVAAASLVAAASAAPPANDDFAAAQVLSGPTGVFAGSNVDATQEEGEPDHAPQAPGHSVWYRWTAPALGRVVFDTCDATETDTVLAVYTGPSVAALRRVVRSDDSCGDRSLVSFTAVAGRTYSIAVDGYQRGGPFTLTWEQIDRPQNDAFSSPLTLSGADGLVTGRSFGARAEAGEPSPARAASIWYGWTAPFTGGVTFETCGSSFDTVLAAYIGTSVDALRAVARDDDDCEPQSRIRFGARAGTDYRIQVYGVNGTMGWIRLAWSGAASPRNDNFAAARVLRGTRGSITGTNAGAVAEPREKAWASVWYRWRAPRLMAIAFSTCSAAEFDTAITVSRGTSLRRAAVVDEADDDCDEGSRAVFVATKGTEYRIAVDSSTAQTGSFNLTWRKPRPFDEPCSVPDVRGDRMASARRRLLAANCLVGRVVRRNSEIVPRARVIAQYPFPGARLPILGRVHLEISSGLGVRPSSSG
jgi:hypothetical protein